MFKEMLIKGGLTVAALLVAETVIGKLEKRALRHDKQSEDKFESKEEVGTGSESDLEMFDRIMKERGFVAVEES